MLERGSDDRIELDLAAVQPAEHDPHVLLFRLAQVPVFLGEPDLPHQQVDGCGGHVAVEGPGAAGLRFLSVPARDGDSMKRFLILASSSASISLLS
jgi:hypothetical protein